jgi:hypothetical protein
MHQQFRLTLAAMTDTPGAMQADEGRGSPRVARPGMLAALADELAAAGINIRSVGGVGIETGGELILAVADEDVDRTAELLGTRFDCRLERPAHEDLVDEPGQLARFAHEIAERDLLIDSIVIGTPHPPGDDHHPPGSIPIQATTVAVGDRIAHSHRTS